MAQGLKATKSDDYLCPLCDLLQMEEILGGEYRWALTKKGRKGTLIRKDLAMENFNEFFVIQARVAIRYGTGGTEAEETWFIGTQIDLTSRTNKEMEEVMSMNNFERLRFSGEPQVLL